MIERRLPLLLEAQRSQLILVDIQPKLAAAMEDSVRAEVIARCTMLIQAASKLEVPILATEQYPNGLGRLEPELADQLPANSRTLEKTSFDCCAADGFVQDIERQERPQVVLTGMEAHVCVLQTAMGLLQAGYEVFVVEDAVASRVYANLANGMQRLHQAGVVVTNTESVLFEWMRDARHEHFKDIIALLR